MSLSLFGPAIGEVAAQSIGTAEIADGAVTPAKINGRLANGRAVLVAGTVTVTPGPAVTATDLVLLHGGQANGGAPGGRYVSAITAGAAGVGTFAITSTNAGDVADVGWLHFDNSWIG